MANKAKQNMKLYLLSRTNCGWAACYKIVVAASSVKEARAIAADDSGNDEWLSSKSSICNLLATSSKIIKACTIISTHTIGSNMKPHLLKGIYSTYCHLVARVRMFGNMIRLHLCSPQEEV